MNFTAFFSLTRYKTPLTRKDFPSEYEQNKENTSQIGKSYCFIGDDGNDGDDDDNVFTAPVMADRGFQECDEEDVETWMACDTEDCAFQMLNDDEIMTSMQEESIQVARVHQMLTRFLR
ncbi:hypothetical protein TNCV_1360291 [Trichonephila clavipes]|nr:hypothetical protein TNCV_1360291 [Trichonephila clavipes]